MAGRTIGGDRTGGCAARQEDMTVERQDVVGAICAYLTFVSSIVVFAARINLGTGFRL